MSMYSESLALKAGEWLRHGRRDIEDVPPRLAAAEQYHLSGCPIPPGHFWLSASLPRFSEGRSGVGAGLEAAVRLGGGEYGLAQAGGRTAGRGGERCGG